MRLELRGITKRFPGVLANDHIDLAVEEGEIHALLGENGAGKTTLMNVLYGLYRPDEGDVLIDGRKVELRDPRDAIASGIGMVHQHFMLVPVFTVAENVVLGNEPVRAAGLLDRERARAEVLAISRRHGLEVDPDAFVEDLPVGIQQRVEIVKALHRGAELLILDEPTAVLTPQETEGLFGVMRSLKEAGRGVIFITHKLREVLEVADRITVLARGRVVGTAAPAEISEAGLAAMMVGRTVDLAVAKGPPTPGEAVLGVSGLVALDDRGHAAVNGADLEVRAGEIVALAGVQGNGQTELVEVLTGLRRPEAGSVRVLGNPVAGRSPGAILALGVAHVPEDRGRDGLVADLPVAHNLVLNTFRRPPYARGPLLDQEAILADARKRVARFDVRTPSVLAPAGTLSGGNQQKVILARELSRPVRLLIAAQPTRGLDVGSTGFVHSRLVAARDEGVAVLLVSSDLDEILALADRIAVMVRGRVVAVRDAGSVGREELGLLMGGGEAG